MGRIIKDLDYSLVYSRDVPPATGDQVNVWHWRTNPNSQQDAAIKPGNDSRTYHSSAWPGGVGNVINVTWKEGRERLYPVVDVELTQDPNDKTAPGPAKQFPYRLELRYSDAEKSALETLTTKGGRDMSSVIRQLITDAAQES